MASRSLDDLRPPMREQATRFLQRASDDGLDILIYCTLRSPEEQAQLWRQGRTGEQIRTRIAQLRQQGRAWVADLIERVGPQPEPKIVTYALPGESAHNYGLALDAVPLVGGKAAWNDAVRLRRMGECGEFVGLEWAGKWTRFKETVHLQDPRFAELKPQLVALASYDAALRWIETRGLS